MERYIIKNKNEKLLDDLRLIEDHINKVFEFETDTFKRKQFMASNFPYCPILETLYFFDPKVKEKISYMMNFYYKQGTAIHDNFQNFLPIADRSLSQNVIGIWKCTKCGDTVGSNKEPKSYPSISYLKNHRKKCLGAYEYKEINIRLGKYLNCYVDDLYKVGKNYYVMEHKSIGDKYVNDANYKKYLPHKNHIAQSKAYAALLYKCLGIRVKGVLINYLSRDPNQQKALGSGYFIKTKKKDIKEGLKLLEKYIKGYEAFFEIQQNNKNIKENIDKIIENKACSCKDDYEEIMSCKFKFKKGGCPMLKDNLCFKKKKLKKYLVKFIKNYKK